MKLVKNISIVVAMMLATMISASTLCAQSIWFTSPSNGGSFYIPPGQSQIGIDIYLDYTPKPGWNTVTYTSYHVDNSSEVPDQLPYPPSGDGKHWGGILLNMGQHTITAELWQIDPDNLIWAPLANASITVNAIQQYHGIVKNDFDGGEIYVDNGHLLKCPPRPVSKGVGFCREFSRRLATRK